MRAAFVIPWYGRDIPGGAEAMCRLTAENLAKRGVDVEVLTTCLHSLEKSWDQDHHPPGETVEAGVRVRRFSIDPRSVGLFALLNDRLVRGESLKPSEQRAFLENMVNSRALDDYISQAQDCLFFPLPYLFSTTWRTIRLRPEASVPIACLHDEGYAYLEPIREAFLAAAGVIFLSPAERELAADIWDLPEEKALFLAGGVETEPLGQAGRFRRRYNLPDPFLLYAGRRDATKNTPFLIDCFAGYKKERAGPLKLVLIGNLPVEVPEGLKGEVIDLGFLPAQDKLDAMAAAAVFCQPSLNESYSIVIMEAWLNQTPVMVHGDCAVTAEHVLTSGGGLTFTDQTGFNRALDQLLGQGETATRMADAGRRYVLETMSWEAVCGRYIDLLQKGPPPAVQAAAQTRPPAIHQVISHLAAHDALGDETLLIRRRLREKNIRSHIYADHIDVRVRRFARPLERLEDEVGPDDLILWHFSTGSRVVDWLAGLGHRPVIMRYHNITPERYFRGIHDQAAYDARLGRRQLRRAAGLTELAIGVSEYNRTELTQAGYTQTAVVPFIRELAPFQAAPSDSLDPKLSNGGPNLLHVGRLAPQKRIEEIIKSFYFLKRLRPQARLFIVGGASGFEVYAQGLGDLVQTLNLDDVFLTGQVDGAALAGYYSLADFYLCLSEHEGFCVPLIEAMSAGLVVVARAAAAIPETLGQAGLLLAHPRPAQVAEAVELLTSRADLRQAILAGQQRRLAEMDPQGAWERLWDLLSARLKRQAGAE